MGWITLLLSGVPSYVHLYDLGYHLECLFATNPEIGTFEVRYLPGKNEKSVVAVDFRSGFDAFAAQEQLNGYRYQMQDGVQYILRAKLTKKKDYLRRGDTSPELHSRSRSSSKEEEASSPVSISNMSDGAMFRADAKLNAKYKLLKKQQLIVKTQLELIKERRKLRREYARGDLDSDDELCSRKPRARSIPKEHGPLSQGRDMNKISQAAKIREFKAMDYYAKELDSISKLRSPRWEKDYEKRSRLEIEPKSICRKRSLQRCRCRSRARSRAKRSRSLTRSSNSRSRTPSPKYLRSRSGIRRSRNKSWSRDTESRDRSPKRISRRERSPHHVSRSKRLRSPRDESRSRSRKSRSRNSKLLAIMPKSPAERESSILRTQPSNWKEYKNTGSNAYKTQPSNWKEYKNRSKDSENPKDLRKSKNTDKEILKDNCRNIDSSDKKKDLKDNSVKVKQINADIKETRSDETRIRLICDDIMFLMNSLLLEITIRENLEISYGTNKLLIEKLNAIVQERVNILYVEQKFTIYNASEIYRKICTKKDDILLIKRLLAEVRNQETGAAETEDQKTSANGANGSPAESRNSAILNVELNSVKPDITIKCQHENIEGQVTEQSSLEIDNGNKAAKVLEGTDVDNIYPKESLIKATNKPKTLPAHPQFVLVIKTLMTQLTSALRSSREKGVFVNILHMEQVLRILLKDMLSGEGYKTTREILTLFRQRHPREKDEEFIAKVAEDINMKKYDLDRVDSDWQDGTDVILTETEPEIVTIEDSDDESEHIRTDVTTVMSSPVLSSCVLTESSTVNKDKYLSEKEIVKDTVNSIAEPKESKERNDINNKFINDLCEKTKEADKNSNIKLTEVSNVIKQEEQQPGETVKEKPECCSRVGNVYAGSRNLEKNNANTMINKEVQSIESELEINKDNREEALKVTAITIMTSESELHSIAHEIENKVKTSVDKLKEELEPELTDEDIEKILSLENIGLDFEFLGCNTSYPCELESLQDRSSDLNVNCGAYNTNDALEKETPQVTAITIMTSTSELLSLNLDDNGNTIKEVSEVKVENNEDVSYETATPVDKLIENKALVGANGTVGNNTEIICPESQYKQAVDDEEESIESICKYITAVCNSS